MCGIAGWFDLRGGRAFDAERFDRMVDVMRSRGPDDRGVSIAGSAGIGARRLSILDLEGGHQPIESEDAAVSVVLNGEIYAYPELRAKLEGQGARFRTRTDTEILLHGYREWGLDGLLARLDGMFAIAIHDRAQNQLHLARDRVGIKPLLYTERDGWLLFGSSLSTLLASEIVPVEPDPIGVRLYLAHQYIPSPHTALRGVHKLSPAHALTVQPGSVGTPHPYWTLPGETDESRSESEWIEAVRAELRRAVESHLLSDVEVGAFLSGGLDSSAIVHLMAQLRDHRVRAFSIGFDGGDGFDETRHAESAAKRAGVELHTTRFTPREMAVLADEVIGCLEEPMGDPACLPTYQLACEASRHLKVVLTGEGADELFGGYGYYRRAPLWFAGGRNNLGRGFVHGVVSQLFGKRDGDELYLSRRFHRRSARNAFPYAMHAPFIERLVPELDADGWDLDRWITANETRWAREGAGGGDSLARALQVSVRGWLPENLLMKVDRMTMAHGLEARVPFLDTRLLETALRIPRRYQMRGSIGKVVLREVARPWIGDELAGRDKHGFSLPLAKWFRTDLRELVRDTLLPAAPSGADRWLAPDAVQALLEAHEARRGDFSRPIWMLVVLKRWFEQLESGGIRADSPEVGAIE